MKKVLFILCSLTIISCKKEVKEPIEVNYLPTQTQTDTSIEQSKITETSKNNSKKTTIKDTSFINIKSLSKDFVLDLKYATEDNFLHQKVYDCAD